MSVGRRPSPSPTPERVRIEIVRSVTDELVEAFVQLTPQLSSSSSAPSAEVLAEIVGSEASTLLIARDPDEGPIVGSMTLALFRIPTGLRAWIEDVVVDESARGRGVGDALNRRALEIAAAAGARTVDLTSRPSREPANRLYRRLGFVERETNVYRYTFPST
jgi:ribosomal protein S18 acetylase RimI-like enzyme